MKQPETLKPETLKIVIHTHRRPDGGLRAWSDDVPGLVLSHADPDRVMADIIPAVETIMEAVLGYPVRASQLVSVTNRAAVAQRAPTLAERLHLLVAKLAPTHQGSLEYVATPAPCLA